MFKIVVLAVLVAATLAGYGLPAGNPPAAPAYPVLPGYPPAFYPYPRRHRHRHHHSHSSSNSDSHSDSHSHETRCKTCKKLRASCRDVTNVEQCREPEISIVRKSGCQHSIISCPPDAEYSLIHDKNTSKIIRTGKASDVLAKCNKGNNWKIDGSTINNVACVVPKKISVSKCEDGWTFSQEGQEPFCFKAVLLSPLVSQIEGYTVCKNDHDAVSAPFRGENDRAAIKEAIKKVLPNPDTTIPYLGFYIGIINFAYDKDGVYNFLYQRDLLPINFTSWHAGEPNKLMENGYWETCVTLMVNDNLNWYDSQCYVGEHRIGIICGKPPK